MLHAFGRVCQRASSTKAVGGWLPPDVKGIFTHLDDGDAVEQSSDDTGLRAALAGNPLAFAQVRTNADRDVRHEGDVASAACCEDAVVQRVVNGHQLGAPFVDQQNDASAVVDDVRERACPPRHNRNRRARVEGIPDSSHERRLGTSVGKTRVKCAAIRPAEGSCRARTPSIHWRSCSARIGYATTARLIPASADRDPTAAVCHGSRPCAGLRRRGAWGARARRSSHAGLRPQTKMCRRPATMGP